MSDIVYFGESTLFENVDIHAVLPSYGAKKIVIISREHRKRTLPDLEYRWNSEDPWTPMDKLVSEPYAPYGWFGAYTFPLSEGLISQLFDGEEPEVEVRHVPTGTTTVLKILDHGLRPQPSNLLGVIQSLNPMFLDSPCPQRRRTLRNFNEQCGSILRRLLPWIEFHITHGISQIFINQPRRYSEEGEDWEPFWKELLDPYLKERKVALVIFEDPANISRIALNGATIQRPTHALISQIWSIWLNKGRATWFGAQDLDEYVVPAGAGYYKEGSQDIWEIMQGLPPKINHVLTPMFMVQAPPKDKILLGGDVMATSCMPKCHKYFAKLDDINLSWGHGVSNRTSGKAIAQRPSALRLNHYRVKTSDGWLPAERLKKWSANRLPHVTEEKLSLDRRRMLDKIKERYGEEHGEFLRNLQKKYSHLPELKVQNLDGE